MAAIRGVIATLWLLVGLAALLLFSADARAVTYDVWSVSGNDGACNAFYEDFGPTPEVPASTRLARSSGCGTATYTLTECHITDSDFPRAGVQALCTYSGTFPGSLQANLTCSPGKQVWAANKYACSVAPPSCVAGGDDSTFNNVPEGVYGVCYNGCAYDLQSGVKNVVTGKWQRFGPQTGATCVPGDGPLPTGSRAVPSSCPAGQIPTEVNGVSVCGPIPASSTQTTKATSSTVNMTNAAGGNPAGGVSSGGSGVTNPTGPDPVASPNSETSVSGETSCTGSTCTTTKTTTTAPFVNGVASSGAGVTSVTVKTESKDDFCVANPRSPMCVSKSISGGGTCSIPITSCDGDAISCSIAKSTYELNCAFQKENATSTLGQAAIDGALHADDPRKTGNVRVVDLPGALTTTNPYGSSCPADKTVALPQGKSMVIPYSTLCTWFVWFGRILVALALLAGLSIVMGGNK